MKFLFLLIYPILSLSCNAMQMDRLSPDDPFTRKTVPLKRTMSDPLSNKRKRENKQDIPQNIPLKKSRTLEPLEPSLAAGLEKKGNLLSLEINKSLEVLGVIKKELGEKIPQANRLAKESNNYRRVSELAGFVVNTHSLNQQAQLLLKNLAPLTSSNNERKTVNKSLAIIASGEFAARVNQFIKVIAQNSDTKEINYEQLEEASMKINQITADIDIRDKLVTLDEGQ